MAALVPHPLVTRVGLDWAQRPGGELPPRVRDVVTTAGSVQAFADAAADDTQYPEAKNELAESFANEAERPELSLFAGFLGGEVSRDDETWQLLYTDSRLQGWLLVPADGIVDSQRVRDDKAPSGLRDVVWVKSASMVRLGSGPQSIEERFLTGELIEAGEFAASRGTTFAADTRLWCEAVTADCYCFLNKTRK